MRWFGLFALILSLSLNRTLPDPVALIIAVGVIGSGALVFWTFFAAQRPWHVYLAVGFDLLLVNSIFYFVSATHGAVMWMGLIPVISAALLLDWPAMLLVVLVNLAFQTGIIYFFALETTIGLFILVTLPLYLGTGFLFFFLRNNLLSANRTKALDEYQLRQSMRQKTIAHMVAQLSASLNYQHVLELVLDQTYRTLKQLGEAAEPLVGTAMLFSGNNDPSNALHVAAGRGLASADMRTRLPGVKGVIGQAVETGKPAWSGDILHDPEISQFISLGAYQSAYCLPLRLGMDTYGVLLFVHTAPDFFSVENREIFDIAASQVVIVIRNAQLYHDLESEKKRMVEIQEEAQNKLARDLQAGPTRALGEIALKVNQVRHLLNRDPKAAEEQMDQIESQARQSTKEIRHMLFTLRPLVLESQGLVAALEAMANKFIETFQQQVELQLDANVVERLEESKQGVIFYLVEEAVNNARKHGEAQHVWISLQQLKTDLALLEIRDDGKGFNIAETRPLSMRGNSGIGSMFERAELLNGMLHIESTPQKGTRVQLAIPLRTSPVRQARTRS